MTLTQEERVVVCREEQKGSVPLSSTLLSPQQRTLLSLCEVTLTPLEKLPDLRLTLVCPECNMTFKATNRNRVTNMLNSHFHEAHEDWSYPYPEGSMCRQVDDFIRSFYDTPMPKEVKDILSSRSWQTWRKFRGMSF